MGKTRATIRMDDLTLQLLPHLTPHFSHWIYLTLMRTLEPRYEAPQLE
jgi:hypothetical protein